MLYVLYGLLIVWAVCNLIVFIKWKPHEMWQELVVNQGTVGRICGNAFYMPCWIVKFIICFIYYHCLCKLGKLIQKAFFAVARFLQVIYHSIVDIL